MPNDVNVVIPTFNRSSIIGDAIESALQQTYDRTVITVVNDGSTDNTRDEVARFLCTDRVRYIELSGNVGTAQAKNVAIALNDCPFMSFHDSDDAPHPEKIEQQVAIAVRSDIRADPILNWSLVGTDPGSRVEVDLVVSEHRLVDIHGQQHHMRRALSLVDDVFPHLQMAAGVPGDWILINCGLFRASVFSRIGGFKDCIEEDRELRNRLIYNGCVIWLIPEILMTKYERHDSLTVQQNTNYDSETRKRHRDHIWQDAQAFRQGQIPGPEVMDLSQVELSVVSYPASPSTALMSRSSVRRLNSALQQLQRGRRKQTELALCSG